MPGSKYSVAVDQLKYHIALHPDAHMFFMQIKEGQQDIIIAIMKQLSLKSG